MKDCYTTLPDGYRLKKFINKHNLDRSDERLGAIIFGILSAIALIGITVLLCDIYMFLAMLVIEQFFLGIPIMFVDFGLMELIRRIIYKSAVGIPPCATEDDRLEYSALPTHYIRPRLTRLAYLLPRIITGALMLAAIIVTGFTMPQLLIGFLLPMLVHFFILSDHHFTVSEIKDYLDDDALVCDTGKVIAIFVRDGTVESEEEAKENEEKLAELEEIREKLARENSSGCRGLSIFYLIVCAVNFLTTGLINVINVLSLEFPLIDKLLVSPAPYLTVILLSMLVFGAVTFGKFPFFKKMVGFLLLFSWLPLLFISAMLTPVVSHTTDIENYGIYDDGVTNHAHFPDEITDEMTPIAYNYFYDVSWDWAYEVYFEVRLTDEAYAAERAKYESELIPAWYAEGYNEYIISDTPGFDYHDDGEAYFARSDIQKIIFHDETNTVIYLSIVCTDPLYTEDSAYYQRFNPDPEEYERVAAERGE